MEGIMSEGAVAFFILYFLIALFMPIEVMFFMALGFVGIVVLLIIFFPPKDKDNKNIDNKNTDIKSIKTKPREIIEINNCKPKSRIKPKKHDDKYYEV